MTSRPEPNLTSPGKFVLFSMMALPRGDDFILYVVWKGNYGTKGDRDAIVLIKTYDESTDKISVTLIGNCRRAGMLKFINMQTIK